MDRITIAFKLNELYQSKMDKLVSPKMRSNASIARYLLDRAIDGTLTPKLTRESRTAKQITVPSTKEFKDSVNALRGATPVSELMESLLDAYEEEQQNQGDTKCN